jgi:hypothetical protein
MQACEHGPRLDDPGDGNRGAFSRGLQTSIHTDLSPNQPGSCSSRYVADMTGVLASCGMEQLRWQHPELEAKSKKEHH